MTLPHTTFRLAASAGLVIAASIAAAPQAAEAATQKRMLAPVEAELVCPDRGAVARNILTAAGLQIPFVPTDRRWTCYVKTSYRFLGPAAAPRGVGDLQDWFRAFGADGAVELRRNGYPTYVSGSRNPRRGVIVQLRGNRIDVRIAVAHLIGRTPGGSHKLYARVREGGRDFLLHGGRVNASMPGGAGGGDHRVEVRNIRVMDAAFGQVFCNAGRFNLVRNLRHKNRFTLPDLQGSDPRTCTVVFVLNHAPGANQNAVGRDQLFGCVRNAPDRAVGRFGGQRISWGNGIDIAAPFVRVTARLSAVLPPNARTAQLNMEAGCPPQNGVMYRVRSRSVTLRR